MRPIKSKAINYGWNPDTVAFRDDRYVRCSRCGFPNHLDRQARAQERERIGWGTNMVSQTAGTARTIYDPVVSAGCAQCGTLLYAK